MSVDAIKGCATGRWPEMLRSLAPHLGSIIDRGKTHGPCPLCGGVDRARCFPDFYETGGIFCNQCESKGGADGLAVLMWANGWEFSDAIGAVKSYLGLNDGIFSAVVYSSSRPQPKKDWARELKQCWRTWDEARPGDSRLRQYLEYRGLSVDLPETLRLHPSLKYWHNDRSSESYPCIVAKIIRDDELVGLHRTYLNSGGPGKADVPCSKKTIKCSDTMTGGSIRVHEPVQGKPLVLCEGIETGLAISDYTGWPVWSCVNNTMMEKVELPDSIRSVFIGADKDLSGAGQASAEKLSRRLVDEGRTVRISLPPSEIPDGAKSFDWLNYLSKEVAHV